MQLIARRRKIKLSRRTIRRLAVIALSSVLAAAVLAFVLSAAERTVGIYDEWSGGYLANAANDDAMRMEAVIILLSGGALAWLFVPKKKKPRSTVSL